MEKKILKKSGTVGTVDKFQGYNIIFTNYHHKPENSSLSSNDEDYFRRCCARSFCIQVTATNLHPILLRVNIRLVCVCPKEPPLSSAVLSVPKNGSPRNYFFCTESVAFFKTLRCCMKSCYSSAAKLKRRKRCVKLQRRKRCVSIPKG